MIVVDLGDIKNPDSESISRKQLINIELNATDISASNYSSSNSQHVMMNYTSNGIVIEVDRYKDSHSETAPSIPDGFIQPKTLGTIYYTPIYTEKLNYDTWLRTINRNFSELT